MACSCPTQATTPLRHEVSDAVSAGKPGSYPYCALAARIGAGLAFNTTILC